jgi:hypothetical protein
VQDWPTPHYPGHAYPPDQGSLPRDQNQCSDPAYSSLVTTLDAVQNSRLVEVGVEGEAKGVTIMSESDDDGGAITCAECCGTGWFGRSDCLNCGGQGYRIMVPGSPSKRRLDKPSRRPTPKKV